MVSMPVEELDVVETLDAVECWRAEQQDRETRVFVAAAHFADLHTGAARDAGGRVLPGMERAKRLGGAGTPAVMEFAAAELGARIGKSPYAGRALMADALDVRHRLPRLWARVRAGQVAVWPARYVAQQTRELSASAAGLVDAEVAGYAEGRIAWSRFETLVAGRIIAADPDAAAERERRAAEEEFAKVGRSNDHGQKTLYVKSQAAAVVRIGATIDHLARALAARGDTADEDHRRAKAMLVLANPVQALALLQAYATRGTGGEPESDPEESQTQLDLAGHDSSDDRDTKPADGASADNHDDRDDDRDDRDDRDDGDGDGGGDDTAGFLARFRPTQASRVGQALGMRFDPSALLPQVTLYLHLYQDAVTGAGPVARWENEGPVTTAYVRDVLGPSCRFTVKPVIDPAGIAPVDAYEIPDRHREAVHLRSPADVFPFATATTTNSGRRRQLDHTRPYIPPDHGGPPGQTDVANLGPLTRFHHRIKTFGAWQVKQPFPGIFVWRDPHGRMYLVDHTGTRKIGSTAPADDDTATGAADIEVEIHPARDDDITIELDHRSPHAA